MDVSDKIRLQVRRVLVPVDDDGFGRFDQEPDEILTTVTDFNEKAVQAIFVSVVPPLPSLEEAWAEAEAAARIDGVGEENA